jgi:excisionase family DNA binding protein
VGEDSAAPRSGRRVTVDEAARHLGLSVDAIRKRVQRGQIPHERDAAGRVQIILDESQTLQDESQDTTGHDAREALVERLRDENAYLRGVIAVRDQELAQRAEEIRRRDAALEREQQLAAFFAERMRELEAPPGAPETAETATEVPMGPTPAEASEEAQEPSEAPEMPTDEQQGRGPVPVTGGPQEATEQPQRRRSWWREFFGFN